MSRRNKPFLFSPPIDSTHVPCCSIAALDDGFFSCSAYVLKNTLGDAAPSPSERNSHHLMSFINHAASDPVYVFSIRNNKNHNNINKQGNMSEKVAGILAALENIGPVPSTSNNFTTEFCVHGWYHYNRHKCIGCINADNAAQTTIDEVRGSLQALMHEMIEEEVDYHMKSAAECFLPFEMLKRGYRFIVANDLEVSVSSSITSIDLLRRHLPSGAATISWSQLVGLWIEVDDDDFRAIARSALSGRDVLIIISLHPLFLHHSSPPFPGN